MKLSNLNEAATLGRRLKDIQHVEQAVRHGDVSHLKVYYQGAMIPLLETIPHLQARGHLIELVEHQAEHVRGKLRELGVTFD